MTSHLNENGMVSRRYWNISAKRERKTNLSAQNLISNETIFQKQGQI